MYSLRLTYVNTFFFLMFAMTIPSLAIAGFFENNDEYRIKINCNDCNKDSKQFINALKSELDIVESSVTSQRESYIAKINRDSKFIASYLGSIGYYNVDIKHSLDSKSNVTTFKLNLNKRYRYSKIKIIINNADSKNSTISIPQNSLLAVKRGDYANSNIVYEDVAFIENWVESNNCLFKHSTKHEAYIDHDKALIDINYIIDADSIAKFGDITFSGNSRVSNSYLEKKILIKKGDCFKRSKLNKAKLNLQRSGLIESVDVKLPHKPNRDSSVPVELNIKEKKHRSIKLGLKYSTDQGLGGDAQWEHRNLFSQGEKLSVKLSAEDEKQNLETTFNKPYFLRTDQRLKLGNVIRQEQYDSYSVTGITFSGGVERDFKNSWTLGLGAKYGFEEITEKSKRKNTALLSTPIFAKQDKRNDLLDPTKGWTLNGYVSPTFDTLQSKTVFVKSHMKGTYYYTLGNLAASPTIAIKAATGSIVAPDTKDVPASERFFTGGGGSVRGYAYQKVGPLDTSNKPIGGRSFVETSLEVRMKFLEDYGIVGFIDGGNTFDDMYPTFKDEVLWGAGIGFRYFTNFGPIRADIAVPINKRKNVDDAYQLYFSIGQAF